MKGVTAVTLFLAVGAWAQVDLWRAEMAEVESHPCLAFGKDDIPLIRERLTRQPYADWWQGVQGASDMVSQAFTWCMTGDRDKAEAARRQLLRSYPAGYHCSCGVADALQGVAEAYDLLYNYQGLTPTDHRVIRAKLAEACERLYLSALESGAGQHPGNQRTRAICALGTAALVLKGYRDSAHTPLEWLQRALDGIHQDANLTFWREDGMFIEGPGYSSFTLSVMIPFARYFHRASGKWLFDDPRLRNALLYLVYITQPDGMCAALGTTNMYNVVNSLRLCIGAGDPCDQRLFRFAIAQWGSLSGGGVRDICLFDDSIAPSTQGFPPTRFSPVSQEASVRSDWGTKAVALWFKGKDPWLAATHQVYSHGDVGSFVIHAYGELLAVDAGYDHWVSYDLYPPELHNTLLVDGTGPVMSTPGLLENTLDAGFLQAGDIVSEYGGASLRRTFLMVDGAYVAIADDIRADAEHEYAWQVHTPVSRREGSVEIWGTRARWTGYHPPSGEAGEVAMEAVWAGPVELRAMEKSRWQPFGADPKTDSYDNWALAALQHGRSPRYLTVLFPHPLRVAAPTIETPEVPGGRCITLADGKTRDTLVVTEGAGVTVGKLATTARTCIIRQRDAGLEWVALAGGGRVEYAGRLVLELSGEGGTVAARVRPLMGAAAPTEGVPVVQVSGPAGSVLRLPAALTGRAVWARVGGDAWRPLAATSDDQGLRVALPEGAERGALVAAAPAGWRPPASDTEPPRIVAVEVDDQARESAETIELGRLAKPPERVVVRFRDERSGINQQSIRVALDGLWLDEGVQVDGEARVTVAVRGAEEATDHELVVMADDLALPPNRARVCVRFSMRPLLANGGFEVGGEHPRGWSLGTWSGDESTRVELRAVTDRPHSGKGCLMIRGISGPLNMVASQSVNLTAGATYVLSGYYRGDVPARASLCAPDGKGQYIWSPPIGPSEEWVPFQWEFTVENTAPTLLIGLRHGNVGAAYFDDVELKQKVD